MIGQWHGKGYNYELYEWCWPYGTDIYLKEGLQMFSDHTTPGIKNHCIALGLRQIYRKNEDKPWMPFLVILQLNVCEAPKFIILDKWDLLCHRHDAYGYCDWHKSNKPTLLDWSDWKAKWTASTELGSKSKERRIIATQKQNKRGKRDKGETIIKTKPTKIQKRTDNKVKKEADVLLIEDDPEEDDEEEEEKIETDVIDIDQLAKSYLPLFKKKLYHILDGTGKHKTAIIKSFAKLTALSGIKPDTFIKKKIQEIKKLHENEAKATIKPPKAMAKEKTKKPKGNHKKREKTPKDEMPELVQRSEDEEDSNINYESNLEPVETKQPPPNIPKKEEEIKTKGVDDSIVMLKKMIEDLIKSNKQATPLGILPPDTNSIITQQPPHEAFFNHPNSSLFGIPAISANNRFQPGRFGSMYGMGDPGNPSNTQYPVQQIEYMRGFRGGMINDQNQSRVPPHFHTSPCQFCNL